MRKWILRSLVSLLLLLVISAAGFVVYLRRNYSPEKIKAELERALSDRTGFAVNIGELDFTYVGDISLKRICIRNPEIPGTRCFVAAEIASLDLAILELLYKRVEIRGIDIAHAQVAFFTAKPVPGSGKRAEIRSWEIAKDSPASAASAAAQRFSLQAIHVSNGEIYHEVPILPLPIGKTEFSARIRAGELQRIESKITLPDRGKLEIKFEGKAANLVTTARSFIGHGKLEDGDIFDGTANCTALNLAPLDPRLRSVTGNFTVGIRQNSVRLKTIAAQVTMLKPVPLGFTFAGEFTVGLPQMNIGQGTGSVSGQGFYVVFNNFSHSAKSGVNGNVAANVELGKIREGVAGKMSVQGVLQNSRFSGPFSVKEFSYPVSNVQLTSAGFAGRINGDSIIIAKQNFALDQAPFTASFQVNRTTSQTEIQAAVDKLSYQKWEVSQISARIISNAEKLRVENGSATLARGRMIFSYAKGNSDTTQILKLSLAGAKAQDLSPMLGIGAKVFGDVSLEATLSAMGSLAERQNLTGPVSFRIGRGKIKDSFFQKGILTGPLHKIEEKFSDIEFVSGVADLTLSRGALSIRRLYFDADEWSVTLRAEADKDLQGKAALDFRFRESFIANVANPLHLGIEGRKEGEFYDLPFACRGNIASGACYKQNW